MTDLVDRLREYRMDVDSPDVVTEAADEIERLRGVAEAIAQAIEALPMYNGGYAISRDYSMGHQRAQNHAARIAREYTQTLTGAAPA